MDKLNVITGATGQLGSHIAEQLRAQGEHVRALARPNSDTSFLRQIGVEVVGGDLSDAEAVRSAVAGADLVYHCAARVSDWGRWADFEAETVTATRNLLDGCRHEKVGRLLHVSSISVYGRPQTQGLITEETPLGQRLMLWDYYPRVKILAENMVREYGGPWTIVRPSWIYGERDRITIPRVVPALRAGRVPVIGSGDNLLNIIYAGDVAAGAILAAQHPGAIGETFNLCSRGEVTQRQLLDTLTERLNLPRIRKRVPFFLALRVAFLKELFARLLGRAKPPTITRRAIYLIGRPTLFSIDKAQRVLGWRPQVNIQEGVRRALEWYFAREGTAAPSMPAAVSS